MVVTFLSLQGIDLCNMWIILRNSEVPFSNLDLLTEQFEQKR